MDREKSRQRILKAAEKLFAQNGFDATSVDKLAKAAKVNKALIYYYFKDKDDVIRSLFREIVDEVNQSLGLEDQAAHMDKQQPDMREKLHREMELMGERRNLLALLLMEALKQKNKTEALFKCAEIIISSEAATENNMAGPDHEMIVFEFFTGFIPMMSFIALENKFADYFGIEHEKLRELFLDAFMNSHLAGHQK